jgi:putative inorganic carbon (hco3(-)) transporter
MPALLEVWGRVRGAQTGDTSVLDYRPDRRAKLNGVTWSMAFVGLLGYTVATVTYALPIGEASMAFALLGIILSWRSIRLPTFLVLFAIFIAWSMVGYSFSLYPEAVRDSVGTAVRIWLIAFVAVNAIRTPAQLRFYLIFVLACFAMYPARGAIFNYIGGYTVWGRALWNQAFGNPNDLAALTFLPLAIAAGLFATEKNRLFRYGALASLVVLPVLILMTQSRGAFIALAIIALVVFVGHRRKARLLIGAAGLALVTFVTVPDSAWDRFAGISSLTRIDTVDEADPEGSARDRLNIWRVAGLIIRDHKAFGVGFGSYPDAHAHYAPAVPEAPQGRRDAHNTYLTVLATTGVPGLLLFLGVLGSSLAKAERTRRRINSRAPGYALLLGWLQAGLIAYLLTGIFGSFAMLSFLYLHLALLSATAAVATADQIPMGRDARSPVPVRALATVSRVKHVRLSRVLRFGPWS